MLRTSCSNKPKEYNPEQEVFVTRDPSYQKNRTHYEDNKQTNNAQSSSPRPPTPHLNGGLKHVLQFQCLVLL